MRIPDRLALSLIAGVTGLGVLCGHAMASAVLPSTSVLVINEADKEGSIGVKNTDKVPVLLYTKIARLDDEDLDAALIPTPAAVLVQPGETQVVRVLYRSNQSLDKEHLARVMFMGIPPKTDQPGRISLMLGQDLPVVIRPKGYKPVDNKWEYLKWRISGDQLCVSNETKYAVRFVNAVKLVPGDKNVSMPKPYSLPGSDNCAPLPSGYMPQAGAQVEFSAVSDYNYILDGRRASIEHVAPQAPGKMPSTGEVQRAQPDNEVGASAAPDQPSAAPGA
ncbi:fimbria/pilus chaperone family protein [Paraburkholderia sp. J12]|uniref:fimbria/pilus chaperone family protein n=1 Tax=Paraburkholderia sp. J12 TaxID=2805432 RepID=UPI002ABD27E6|nr:fimbria/pilus chaperone family protein [Paraburkholderia sp. J12]